MFHFLTKRNSNTASIPSFLLKPKVPTTAIRKRKRLITLKRVRRRRLLKPKAATSRRLTRQRPATWPTTPHLKRKQPQLLSKQNRKRKTVKTKRAMAERELRSRNIANGQPFRTNMTHRHAIFFNKFTCNKDSVHLSSFL